MIKNIIENECAEHISSGKFSISGVGGCLREKYFMLWKKYNKSFSPKTKRIFALGDFVHRQCVTDLLTNSASHGYEVIACEVNIPHNDYFSGRVDCILSEIASGEKVVVDFKSSGTWTFNKVSKGEVQQNYLDQVNLYMHLLGIHKGYLVFVCKNNSEIVEHEVIYDETRAKNIIKEIEDFFTNNVFKGILPTRCDGGMFGCDVCDENGFDTDKAQQEIEDDIKNGKNYQSLYEQS